VCLISPILQLKRLKNRSFDAEESALFRSRNGVNLLRVIGMRIQSFIHPDEPSLKFEMMAVAKLDGLSVDTRYIHNDLFAL